MSDYIIGSGDVEFFKVYYTAGSTHTKFYVSHIGKDEDWFFTNDEYEAEAFYEVEARAVVDKASEKFGIELTIEGIDDE